jgi:hypothetical protein
LLVSVLPIGTTLNFVDAENIWHLMSWRLKLSTAELVDLMFTYHERYGLEAIGYERTAFTEGMQAYLDGEMRRRNRFLPLVQLSHRQTNKQVRIQQSLEPRYNRKGIVHLKINGINQCVDLEGELLSFPKAANDDASDSAAYQSEIAQAPSGVDEQRRVTETRQRLTANQSR